VLGESNIGVGVQGHAFKDTGVIGRSVSGIGVYAETSDGIYCAVGGQAPKAAGVLGTGRYGVWGSGSEIGVYGQCSDGYAGYFNGNVFIKGDLTKTGMGARSPYGFRIGHFGGSVRLRVPRAGLRISERRNSSRARQR
jgi:hypothetical protein